MDIDCVETGSGEVTITPGETFDFNCVEDFRILYEGIQPSHCKKLVVDLRRAHYMDSSALGMLINMRKFWQDRCDEFYIINTNPQIKKIFTISRFDKKFTID